MNYERNESNGQNTGNPRKVQYGTVLWLWWKGICPAQSVATFELLCTAKHSSAKEQQRSDFTPLFLYTYLPHYVPPNRICQKVSMLSVAGLPLCFCYFCWKYTCDTRFRTNSVAILLFYILLVTVVNHCPGYLVTGREGKIPVVPFGAIDNLKVQCRRFFNFICRRAF